MDAATAEVVRRFLLMILDAVRTKERAAGEDTSTYTAEALIQSKLRMMGVAMTLSSIRAELFFLHDEGLVKFHRERVGIEDYYSWRIQSKGVNVLAGRLAVVGVASE